MLIPSKCPGATAKAKVTVGSDSASAQHQQETDTVVKWDRNIRRVCFLLFYCWLVFLSCVIAGLCIHRSSSVDTPPVETIVSSVVLDEEVKEKETEADVNEDYVEESLTPAITQPPHTSPDVSFASEVTSPTDSVNKLWRTAAYARNKPMFFIKR